jgi:hypothetical protein
VKTSPSEFFFSSVTADRRGSIPAQIAALGDPLASGKLEKERAAYFRRTFAE